MQFGAAGLHDGSSWISERRYHQRYVDRSGYRQFWQPLHTSGSLTEADEASGNNTITVILPPSVSFIPFAALVLTDSACSPNCAATDISDIIFTSDGSQLFMRSGRPLTTGQLLTAIALANELLSNVGDEGDQAAAV